MNNHYPTTAELAAFRRSIPQEPGSLGYRAIWASGSEPACRPPVRHTGRYLEGISYPITSGTFVDEREHGIGYRVPPAPASQKPRYMDGDATRRGTSAMRSRAYTRMVS